MTDATAAVSPLRRRMIDYMSDKGRTIILSPLLLSILRTYWRLAMLEGWLLLEHGDKLFDVQGFMKPAGLRPWR